ncbi:helix-turn-helix domain-containing protein [Actinomadura oligospora]|uniref:helix-turn-helix domain-containing protein n=1 Tax=Actinomadura oligospora TaxID=111804 RepID=UPI0004B3C7D8|nr:helix-turn-helix transcriptional regulator [Actinomadura oligospora]
MRKISSTVARRRLAREMKRLREQAGKKREESAAAAEIAPATLSRIEAGTHSPKYASILALCLYYGLDLTDAQAYAELARQSKGGPGWWHRYSDVLPKGFEILVGLEDEARGARSYNGEFLDGLLQTERYMRALLRSEPETPTEEQIEQRVAVRLRRQERMLRAPDAPQLWIVQSEASIRRLVGGPAVMKEQLDHLRELSLLNNVTIQVLPFISGAHPAGHGDFRLLDFSGSKDPEAAYVEYRLGNIILEEPEEVATYAKVFDLLRADALGPDATRALLGEVAAHL